MIQVNVLHFKQKKINSLFRNLRFTSEENGFSDIIFKKKYYIVAQKFETKLPCSNHDHHSLEGFDNHMRILRNPKTAQKAFIDLYTSKYKLN